MKKMLIAEIDWRLARDFVEAHHRHHKPPLSWKCGFGVFFREKLVGVAIIGRPSSRILQARGYLEVTRTCTTAWGANRLLYEFIGDIARQAGSKICTYTLYTESGKSLWYAGWQKVACRPAKLSDWQGPGRRRQGHAERPGRIRWEPMTDGNHPHDSQR